MLEHVECIGGVERAGHGAGEHVMDERLDRPMPIHPLFDIGDEQRIEVDGGDLADGLLNDARPESIGAADLQHPGAARQHLGDELVAR